MEPDTIMCGEVMSLSGWMRLAVYGCSELYLNNMRKEKRIVLTQGKLKTLTVVAVVAALVLGMSSLAMASQIAATKTVVGYDSADPWTNTFYPGQTIHYVMTLTNPVGNPATNTLTRIWDTLPNGTVVELLPPGETLVQVPGQTTYFYVDYVVDYANTIEFPPGSGKRVVVNRFRAEGFDSLDNIVEASVSWNSPIVYEELEVSKTVVTSFDRTHKWDIDKKVETEFGHTIGEEKTPKIWLYEDGSGDETATWTVDVTYEGYDDTNHKVSGTVTIKNTGTAPAKITSVTDLLGGTAVDVDFAVTFPYTLAVGDTLVGTYSESGVFEGQNVVTVITEMDTYDDTEDIVWGAPANEYLKTVNIKDISDLNNDVPVDLGSVTAPNDKQFTYSKEFKWTDYTTPGPHIIDNTAVIVETKQEASARLKINWLNEDLKVTKTVNTYFERTHAWDIEKKVETEFGHTIGDEKTPKIWLYVDGSGDEKATWTIDVLYDGFRDHDKKVYGKVTIENTGTEDAMITDVTDVLGGTTIPVNFGVTFPYKLVVGATLEGTYEEFGNFTGQNIVTVTTEVDKYGDTKDIVWGDPAKEHLKTVHIEDISDLNNDVPTDLGTVTAPNGKQFTYSKEFKWVDFDDPGPHVIDNTAIIVETQQQAMARLKINWVPPAALGDFVWDDLNKNGIQDAGEPGIAGVTVNLWNTVNCLPNAIIATQLTDVNGYYLFNNLMAGDYIVEFVLPTGYTFTLQYQGVDPAIDSNADPATGITGCITLASGETNLTIDAGMYIPMEKTCETAMARMYDDPENFTYKFNKHPWFSYLKVTPTAQKQTFYYYAAQHYKVGEVDIWKEGGYLYVDVRLFEDFELKELHINVQTSLTATPSPQSTAFGKYPYTSSPIAWKGVWDGKQLFITVHGVVCGYYD